MTRLLTPAIFEKITKLPIKWFAANLDAIHAEYPPDPDYGIFAQ